MGELSELFRIIAAGALFRIGERFYRLAVAIGVTAWLVRHAHWLALVALGLWAWAASGSLAVALAMLAALAALWMAGRVAVFARRGSAATVGAILASYVKAAKFRRQWRAIAKGAKLTTQDEQGRRQIAPIRRMASHQTGFTVEVDHGAVFLEHSAIAAACGPIKANRDATRVRARLITNSAVSRLTVDYGQHLRQSVRLWDIPPATNEQLISFGIDENGGPSEKVYNTSIMLAGMTRSGKSTAMWCLLEKYMEQYGADHIEVWAVDWAGTEFRAMQDFERQGGFIHRYTSDKAQFIGERAFTNGFWHDLDRSLQGRLHAMQEAGLWFHTPGTGQDRLKIVIVDELVPLTDDLKKRGAAHPLAVYGSQGAKADLVCIIGGQAAHVDVTGRMRTFIPDRACFATNTREETDAALGTGAHAAGALSSELDLLQDRGVFYMREGTQRYYSAHRTAWVTPEERHTIAEGRIPERPPDVFERPGLVYGARLIRPYTDPVTGTVHPVGTLAYIGSTEQAFRDRLRGHEFGKDAKPWYHDCEWFVVQEYPAISLALAEEERLVRKERPLFNDKWNHSNPFWINWRRNRNRERVP